MFNRNREGYPESIPQDKSATTEIPSNEGAMYQSGEFICLYDGEGQIELADDAQSIQVSDHHATSAKVNFRRKHLEE